MVNRGPQLVQLIKGYLNRLSFSSKSSCRQSSQTAESTATIRSLSVLVSVSLMINSAYPSGAAVCTATSSILASGGAFCFSSSTNFLSDLSSPSTSMSTPLGLFLTAPLRECDLARPYTKGRKPTPWTIPFTVIKYLAIDNWQPRTFLSSCGHLSLSRFRLN